MEPITLTTERLRLRPLEPGDADAVVAACQDPDIPRWTAVPSPYTHEHAADFIGRISADGWREENLLNFGVFTLDGGALVSSMGLMRFGGSGGLAGPERQAELGFWTAKEQRRKGYTAEAARAVCAWGFETLGLERIEWYAEAGNEGSRAVALSVGFVMEGTVRSKIVQNGTRRDAWSASLLPSDWGRASKTPYTPYGASEA
ncbi:Protein N-acetyltransferase, RimJ/RimL family [Actinacidiphila alni]|uniref:Protein N-acetyltransferase, RimJ/RimL family n=1 Tax=Actinacidiphila alni TaxID=380248 RepID=A0A1I2MBJ9_9ACTN|nr:GNAT family N-acetyltransferase [Actinacidiphila alni]SFF86611.1 Protein N-acetyltransferase, RimJ/RimL family [Actinacidiphila alni]